MPSSIVGPPFRRLLLAFTIVAAHLATASATPVPALQEEQILDCPRDASTCEGEGVTVAFLASGTSADSDILWSIARIALQPEATVQSSAGDVPTRYSIYIEEGTVGLRASTPVTCFGVCEVETPLPAATPADVSTSGVAVPPGVEVMLAPGDLVTFEEATGSTHIYRNAGGAEADVVSTVFGPSTPARCYGRCLDGF